MCKEKNILLSIVLPVRNELGLIDLCSALSDQDFKDLFEVIIVDESDPNYRELTVECYKKLQRDGIHAKLILNAERRGVGYSMVQGLLHAKGAYVFFLDADNRPVKSFIRRIVEEILSENDEETVAISFFGRVRYRKSLVNMLLLVPRLYLSCIIGGLKYDKKYGFINVLRALRREVLLNKVGVEIDTLNLSYLDNPSIRRKLGLLLSEEAVRNISEVLIEDVRNVHEDFDLNFIYTRIKWYTKGLFRLLQSKRLGFREKFNLMKSMLFYIILLPSTSLVLLVVLMLLTLCPPYAYLTLAFTLTIYIAIFVFSLQYRNVSLNKETFLTIVTLPLLLLINSVATYIALINVIKEEVRK